MNYLAELRALETDDDFSETPKSPSVESVETPQKHGLDTFDTTPPPRFQKKTPTDGPQEPPEGTTLGDGMADPDESWYGFTLRGLLALADPPERADLEASPEVLEAFAHALEIRAQRERGERPAHYTEPALCGGCGPVWLWPGERTVVQGCPWCFNRAAGKPIPRPPVACADCRHWRPDSINPPGGLGSCTAEAPASKRPGSLWPRGAITCGDWHP